MKKLSLGILLGALILFFFLTLSQRTTHAKAEAFWTSPGTLVQLETSHVPTEEDVVEMLRERQRVQRDLLDMTGSP